MKTFVISNKCIHLLDNAVTLVLVDVESCCKRMNILRFNLLFLLTEETAFEVLRESLVYN